MFLIGENLMFTSINDAARQAMGCDLDGNFEPCQPARLQLFVGMLL